MYIFFYDFFFFGFFFAYLVARSVGSCCSGDYQQPYSQKVCLYFSAVPLTRPAGSSWIRLVFLLFCCSVHLKPLSVSHAESRACFALMDLLTAPLVCEGRRCRRGLLLRVCQVFSRVGSYQISRSSWTAEFYCCVHLARAGCARFLISLKWQNKKKTKTKGKKTGCAGFNWNNKPTLNFSIIYS